jgi:serine/threonine protein kinase
MSTALLQNRYQIQRRLGQGGMGAVYEAIDNRLSCKVALKEALVQEEELRQAFEKEARLLANLNHPSLPRVIDYFNEDSKQYLVMDYVQGDDLYTLLKLRGCPFPVNDILRWADDLLDALNYLHSKEPPILHRDIKPANLKIDAKGRAVLLDFGLAKGHAGLMTLQAENRSILGYSRNYSSPEQIQDTGTTALSDIYSLSATLYHLLTNQRPPDAGERVNAFLTDANDPLIDLKQINSEIPDSFAVTLMRALSLKPNSRPQNASEMKSALHTNNSQIIYSELLDEEEKLTNIKEKEISKDKEIEDLLDGTLGEILFDSVEERRISPSLLQKWYGYGYEDANSLVDQMIDLGWVTRTKGAKTCYLTNLAFETVALQKAQEEIEEEVEEAKELPGKNDPLFDEALRAVVQSKRASTSLLQRHLRIGYGRSAAILDAMVQEGYIGDVDGSSRARPILQKAYDNLLKTEVNYSEQNIKEETITRVSSEELVTVIRNNQGSEYTRNNQMSTLESVKANRLNKSNGNYVRSNLTRPVSRPILVDSRKSQIKLLSITLIILVSIIAGSILYYGF